MNASIRLFRIILGSVPFRFADSASTKAFQPISKITAAAGCRLNIGVHELHGYSVEIFPRATSRNRTARVWGNVYSE